MKRPPVRHRLAFGLLTLALLATLARPAAVEGAPGFEEFLNAGAGGYFAGLAHAADRLWISQPSAAAVRIANALGDSRLVEGFDQPADLLAAPDHAVWLADRGARAVVRLAPDPADPSAAPLLTRIPLADFTPNRLGYGVDGTLWFTDFEQGRIGRLDLTAPFRADYAASEPHAPTFYDLPAGTRPLAIANDRQGNLWITAWGTRRLIRIDRDDALTDVPLASGDFRPTEILHAPDGGLWLLHDIGTHITRLNPLDGTLQTFSLPSVNHALLDLAAGGDGRVWLVGTHMLGSFIATAAGPVDYQEIALPHTVFEGDGRARLSAADGTGMIFSLPGDPVLYRLPLVDTPYRDIQLTADLTPPVVLAAGAFTVEVQVHNASAAPANGVELSFDLPPAHVDFTGIRPSSGAGTLPPCIVTARQVRCALGTFAAAQTQSFTLDFSAARAAAAQQTLLLRADLPAGDYLPANNAALLRYAVMPGLTYANDFASAAEPERWSDTSITRGALGAFGNDPLTFTLAPLPPHDRLQLCYTLHILGDWDGSQFTDPNAAALIGPDLWSNYWQDEPLLLSSFSNQARFLQSYPARYPQQQFAAQQGARRLGDFDGDGRANDAAYDFCYTRPHTLARFNATFLGVNLAFVDGERWALDDVRVHIYYQDAYEWQYLPLVLQ